MPAKAQARDEDAALTIPMALTMGEAVAIDAAHTTATPPDHARPLLRAASSSARWAAASPSTWSSTWNPSSLLLLQLLEGENKIQRV